MAGWQAGLLVLVQSVLQHMHVVLPANTAVNNVQTGYELVSHRPCCGGGDTTLCLEIVGAENQRVVCRHNSRRQHIFAPHVFDQSSGMVTGHACYLVKLPAFDNKMHLDSACVTLATPKSRLGAWFMM